MYACRKCVCAAAHVCVCRCSASEWLGGLVDARQICLCGRAPAACLQPNSWLGLSPGTANHGGIASNQHGNGSTAFTPRRKPTLLLSHTQSTLRCKTLRDSALSNSNTANRMNGFHCGAVSHQFQGAFVSVSAHSAEWTSSSQVAMVGDYGFLIRWKQRATPMEMPLLPAQGLILLECCETCSGQSQGDECAMAWDNLLACC